MSTLALAVGSAAGLRALSLLMGVFLLFMGIDKLSWLTDARVLAGRFQEWLETAPPASRWYLEKLAIPGAPVFARLVPLAEMAAWCRARVRVPRACGGSDSRCFMVLNFHFASDVLFHYSYLTNGTDSRSRRACMALALGGAGCPLSLSK